MIIVTVEIKEEFNQQPPTLLKEFEKADEHKTSEEFTRFSELYYAEMIASLERERIELRTALHNLVEACHRADNDGELAGAIDGKLMDEAWRVLKE